MAEAEEFRDHLGRTLFHAEVFAEALGHCKSREVRQECLSRAINVLLMNHSAIFMDIIRELEKQHLAVMNWTEVPTFLIPYEEVYKSLMMVTANDMVGKEEMFVDKLKDFLHHAVEHKSNPTMSLKICAALEMNPVLKTVYESLLAPIEQTKNEFNKFEIAYSEGFATSHHTSIDRDLIFEKCKTEVNKGPDCYEPLDESPEIKYKYSSNNYLDEMIAASISDTSSILPDNQNIVSQKMDDAVADWLDKLHLTKYQWFFNSLSYHDIVSLDEDNIKSTISKVNRLNKNGNSIKKGIQERICAATKELKLRPLKLDNMKSTLRAIYGRLNMSEISAYVKYMQMILCYPIPNELCVKDDQEKDDLSIVTSLICIDLLRRLRITNFLKARSILMTTVKKFYECLTMIARNQAFKADDVLKMDDHARSLMKQINSMRRDFD